MVQPGSSLSLVMVSWYTARAGVCFIFSFCCYSFTFLSNISFPLLSSSLFLHLPHPAPLFSFIHTLSISPFYFTISLCPLSPLYFVLFSFPTQCTLYKVGSCIVVMLCPMKVNELCVVLVNYLLLSLILLFLPFFLFP